jgi:hypothetical protein
MLIDILAAPSTPVGSTFLHVAFIALAVSVGGAFIDAVHRVEVGGGHSRTWYAPLGMVTWMATTWWLAAMGRLHFEAPPTILGVFLGTGIIAALIAFSPLGLRLALGLPLWRLVGMQGFRLLVELLLHRAYSEGLMPVQMTYVGRNFDIVTGVTAVAVALWAKIGRPSRWVVLAWNLLGTGLLLNILVVALLSSPLPIRRFWNEPSNVWVTHAPWVWLPAVLVLAALLGHLLVFRRLWHTWSTEGLKATE